ncbi:ABC transporter permease [Parasulfitobacter algicola]|uniref:Oligopeptide transport system permease protein OppC n=1 Tax=Parasulfitobacter algicola TaxID=2614809 RepID=A0ABX2IW03_9RHOB|nr:ABC transporter permease subunit [Sulfitobacter algicola]NSX54373.1 ABC transporter permease subunit [Sulfitobacter algicola]
MSDTQTDIQIDELDLGTSRSLWATAWLRLRKNKAAMASLAILIIYILIGTFGPMLTTHDYDNSYRDFTREPASLQLYPPTEDILPSAERVITRARLQPQSVELDGDILTVTATSSREIDERVTRYMDRSDLFANTRVIEISPDNLTVTMQSDVQRYRFIFGTDSNGRDQLARIVIAIRISLLIGAAATAVALLIGVLYGAIAGFIGGMVDSVMMRVVDILYSLPFIFFVILLVVFFGNNIFLMFIAVGAIEWLDMARIVRGQTLSLRRREFVSAAEALGVKPVSIVKRHIIPNTLGPVIVYTTLMVPKVILLESFLSFLGLGVQNPLTSLGVLISNGSRDIQGTPYLLIYPSLALTILLFALNFLGDGLRDALDPKDR